MAALGRKHTIVLYFKNPASKKTQKELEDNDILRCRHAFRTREHHPLLSRPFGTVEEMDEVLVANWNGRVGGNDTVYFLGDLFFRASTDRVKDILGRLKGRKHLVIGNHDSSWMDSELVDRHFVDASNFLDVSDGGRHLVMCHYPLLCWGGEGKSWMIHGHIHNNRHMDYWPLLQVRERVLNAGVEINGYVPVTFEELVENNARQKQLPQEAKMQEGQLSVYSSQSATGCHSLPSEQNHPPSMKR